DTWELAQAELHGRMSRDRIQKLQSFLGKTSSARAVGVCILLPHPCVLMVAALEIIPLSPPKAGTRAN
ncbi:hypothetical protein PHYSODRAFT_448734, partial [Phytophthora sojae]